METLKNKTDQQSTNNHEVHNPHDKHAFNAFKEKTVAKDMFLSYLPSAIIDNALFSRAFTISVNANFPGNPLSKILSKN